ncbi:TerD family protein [Thiorhodovibrio frisius]|uniref:Putative stress response protein, TerZ-and CABP1 n=1 Tax=Thiorhodovibrio frisius TaxID=631362 RepID=H8YX63_9GAMM|nr:TerD family protein [Thiorhodovibrio frisius]EIC23039.1 putative stress response protein, TerZ- and CABP1 [Thiorhodovibrio frisius]WPL22696.1 General stress protein 16U [Thiorhodovibrio frisius]
MAVLLKKGGSLSLSKTEPGLTRILVGLGWQERATNGEELDLDASAFLLGGSGKVRRDEDFVFYHQLVSLCGSVTHTGDVKVGTGEGDDEAIEIELTKVPEKIERIVICVTIHDAEVQRQNFGQVSDAFIRIVNLDTDGEIARFDLSEDYSTETAMIFGEIYRQNSEWKFKAVGQGFSGGLEGLCHQFGVDVA